MTVEYNCRKEYVALVTQLSLRYALIKKSSTNPFEKIVTEQTPLYRLTILWDGVHNPGYHKRNDRDEKWYKRINGLSHLRDDEMEDQGLMLLWDILEPRIEDDLRRWPWIPSVLGKQVLPENHFGFFIYRMVSDSAGKKEVALHMGNVSSPRSPFDNRPKRMKELNELLDAVEDRYGGIDTLRCSSWLNSFKPFVDLFPDGWEKNAAATSKVNYSYGWWGQMIDRRGSFHCENGRFLRKSGRFKYPTLTCRTDIRLLRNHLVGYGRKYSMAKTVGGVAKFSGD